MINIISDRNNLLLKRREIECIFKDKAGKITREDAINIIKNELGIDKVVIPIKMLSEYGKRDVKAIIYIYDDKEVSKKYLPEYILKRAGIIEEKKESKNEQA
ncbi:MAG: hypothetical protein QW416_03205 [Candidatus Nitrosocaldaceae archaeon]